MEKEALKLDQLEFKAAYLGREEREKKVILEGFQHFQAPNTFNMMAGPGAFQVPMCLSLRATEFV